MTRWTRPIAIALVVAACGRESVAPAQLEPTAAVEVIDVSLGAVEATLTAFGVVELDPDMTRTIPFPVAGQVARVAVVPGQPVSAGELLVEIGGMPSQSLDARRASIDLEFAERELARTERLFAEQLATNADRDTARKNVAAARAALESLGGGRTRPTALRASEDSVVAEVMATAGSVVQAGQPAVMLAPRGAVVARVGFEPEDMADVHEDARVHLEPLFAEAGAPVAEGYVSHLHQGVNPATQLVELLLRVDSPPAWMVAGTKVRASAVTRRAENVVVVSHEALLERADGTGAFVVENGRAHWRPVEVGIESDSLAEARSGLRAGERVVTAGRTSLEEGMRVRTEGEAPRE